MRAAASSFNKLKAYQICSDSLPIAVPSTFNFARSFHSNWGNRELSFPSKGWGSLSLCFGLWLDNVVRMMACASGERAARACTKSELIVGVVIVFVAL